MKNLLLGAVFAVACIGSAHATITTTVTAPGLAVGACDVSDGGSGAISTTCSGGIFSNIGIQASGPPLLNAPDLTATALTVTTTGTGGGPQVLDVIVNSAGFAFGGGAVEALFTVNNLVGGGTGPFTLTASAPVGTLSHAFSDSGSETDGPTVLGAFTTDTAEFTLTFAGNVIQSVDATIEIVGVPAPEPMSAALLGVGLIGLGLTRVKRRSV